VQFIKIFLTTISATLTVL